MRNPIDATRPEETRIADISRAAFDRARRLPLADIEKAIRRGSAVALFKLPAWRSFLAGLDPLEAEIAGCAEKGARHGVASLRGGPRGSLVSTWPNQIIRYPVAASKPILLDPEIAELAANWARYHAAQLIRGIDARQRANIRRLVRNAARRLARNPRGVVIEQLAREIREQIGLTTPQGIWISKWVRTWIDEGKTYAQVQALKADKIAQYLDGRAKKIAAREVAESFNEGTLRAAKLAQKKDRLPTVAQKIARTMEDDRVRDLHQLQANLGAVPLDADFPVFSAPRPPWPGEPG